MINKRFPEIAMPYGSKDDGSIAFARPEEDRIILPWAFMSYEHVIQNGLMPALRVHMASFVEHERRDEYRKYLINNCNFPAEWTGNE